MELLDAAAVRGIELCLYALRVELLQESKIALPGERVVGLKDISCMVPQKELETFQRLLGTLKLGEDTLEHHELLSNSQRKIPFLESYYVPQLELIEGQLQIL